MVEQEKLYKKGSGILGGANLVIFSIREMVKWAICCDYVGF